MTKKSDAHNNSIDKVNFKVDELEWVKISAIFSGVENLVDNHNWDMSVGENASVVESFYRGLSAGFPTTKQGWHDLFKAAAVKTWGVDNTCDAFKDAELYCMAEAIFDSYDQEYEDLQKMFNAKVVNINNEGVMVFTDTLSYHDIVLLSSFGKSSPQPTPSTAIFTIVYSDTKSKVGGILKPGEEIPVTSYLLIDIAIT